MQATLGNEVWFGEDAQPLIQRMQDPDAPDIWIAFLRRCLKDFLLVAALDKSSPERAAEERARRPARWAGWWQQMFCLPQLPMPLRPEYLARQPEVRPRPLCRQPALPCPAHSGCAGAAPLACY